MAEAANECEFWLPPKFFTDNEYTIDRNYKKRGSTGIETNYRKQSPYKSGSFLFPSDLSSTDNTEKDEDDYLSGLTRKMAYTSIEDDYLQQGSAKGLVNSMFNPQPVNRDLLYAAAKEIALMKLNKDFHGLSNDGELLPFINANIEAASGYNNRQRLLSLQKLQFMQLRQLQIIMKKQQSLASFCGNISATRPSSLSHLHSTQQNHRKCLSGSDNALMAVKTTVARRQSAGTGVFLPRQPLTRPDSAMKQDPVWLRNPKPRSMPSQRNPKPRSLSKPAECLLPQEWSY